MVQARFLCVRLDAGWTDWSDERRMERGLAAVILAAGKGVRMESDIPKVLHRLAGRSLLERVLGTVRTLNPDRIVVVVGFGRERLIPLLEAEGVMWAVQDPPLGTGDALRMGYARLAGFRGTMLVLNGDAPVMGSETLGALVEAHRRSGGPATFLTASLEDPEGFGRIIRNGRNRFLAIREQKDCSSEELRIREVNAGFYCFESEPLGPALARLERDNAQREFYVTDLLKILAGEEGGVHTMEAPDPFEVSGVNSRTDLERLESELRRRERGYGSPGGRGDVS